MALLHYLLGVLALTATVPSVLGLGCPSSWYHIGNKCFQFVTDTPAVWESANEQCTANDARATLAVVNDYITQAVIVSLMKGIDGDVYIGLRKTVDNPTFHYPSGDIYSYERWAVNEPDGNVYLTNKDYCVILDNNNYNLPGRWYDVPCTESHFYICSMPLDPDSDTNYPQPGVQCLTDFVPYGTSCFGVFGGGVTDSMTFDDAQEECEKFSGTSDLDVSLATLIDGYDSALLNVAMFAKNVDSAWIGFKKGSEGAFEWQSGYPVVYTNWGPDEPSGASGEGCVKENKEGYWDDTTCLDKSAYVCRYDFPPLPVPTPPPDVDTPCPDGSWKSLGSYCYLFPSATAQWGEANFRCMQQYGASLVSISSDSENEFVRSNSRHPSGSDNYMWIGLTRQQTTAGDWGTFGWVDETVYDYAFWTKGEPDGNREGALEFCATMSMASGGAWKDVICYQEYQYVCKLRKRSGASYTSTQCVDDRREQLVADGSYCYLPSVALLSSKRATWNQAENSCRSKGAHLVSIQSEDEQRLVSKLAYGLTQSYWIGLREHQQSGEFVWSDGSTGNYKNFPDEGPGDLKGEEQCTDLLIWKEGQWGTSACGNILPYICKRENQPVTVIAPIPGPPTTGNCPANYFKLGSMCYILRGVEANQRKNWIDARNDCQKQTGGTLATISGYGQQAILTSIIKALEREMDMWIGLNSIGIHYQYHWTDETPLDFTQWMEGAPDSTQPIEDPDSNTCVVMMNAAESAGLWNDVQCSIERAYLCQAPVDPSNPVVPPAIPPGTCPNNKFTSYFDTCLTAETSSMMSFDDAREKCKTDGGDLISTYDQYEVAFLAASLYQDGLEPDGEGWIGLKRNAKTGVFEWLDNWPMTFTKWDNDEPNNNKGDCVAVDRRGKWAVRDCNMKKYFFCEFPNIKPTKAPKVSREGCLKNYVALPGSDFCYNFKTDETKIPQSSGDYFCNRDFSGRLPSIHSKAEEDFVKKEAKKVFGSNALVWLGLDRAKNGRNRWMDRTLLDYVNWITGEPNGDDDDNVCTALDVDGGWKDVDCTVTANYICKAPKFLKPPTTGTSGAAQLPMSGLTVLLLAVTTIWTIRR